MARAEAKLIAQGEALVAEAWAAYAETGDPRDEAIARMIAEVAAQPSPAKPRPKQKPTHASRKRKAFKHCVRLDASAPILQQVRTLVR